MAEHHIAENGRHLVYLTKRVHPYNVHEIAGFDPEIASKIVANGDGEYASRIVLKKDVDPKSLIPESPPAPKYKSGTLVAAPADKAESMVKAGEAEYVTPKHLADFEAARLKADREHAEKMAQSIAFASLAPRK